MLPPLFSNFGPLVSLQLNSISNQILELKICTGFAKLVLGEYTSYSYETWRGFSVAPPLNNILK